MTDVSIVPSVVIDPRNEDFIAEDALRLIYELSEGALNDTTDHNPATVLNRSLARLCAELLWYANKLPRALVVEFLRLTEVQRSLGQRARTRLRFTLSTALTTTYSIPLNFEVSSEANPDIKFTTVKTITFSPGMTSAEVDAVCTVVGSTGNVPVATLTRFNVPYAFLREVTNVVPGFGGSDLESFESVERRALNDIRQRDVCISKIDYETTAESILGNGSRAVAVPLVGGDGVSFQLGSVHVFGLNADGTLPTQAQSDTVQSELANRVPLGSSVYFSPVTLLSLNLRIIGQLNATVNPDVVYNSLRTELYAFLNPLSYSEPGHVVLDDIEFVGRSVVGIKRINAVLINNLGSDVILETPQTLPFIESLYVELINADKTVHRYGFGNGDPD